MRRSAALLAFLLAACASPQRVVEQGSPQEFASSASALSLVKCLTLNARSISDAYTADWSALVRPDSFEAVVIRTSSPVYIYTYQPIIVARTAPAPGGSQLKLYFSGNIGPAETADWIARLRNGCENDTRASILAPMVPRDAMPAENPPPPPVPASPRPAERQPRG
jgi:hypothetical protein